MNLCSLLFSAYKDTKNVFFQKKSDHIVVPSYLKKSHPLVEEEKYPEVFSDLEKNLAQPETCESLSTLSKSCSGKRPSKFLANRLADCIIKSVVRIHPHPVA